MTDRTFATALIALASTVSAGLPTGQTLAECNAFADLFANTCTVTDGVPAELSSLSSHAGTDMTCEGTMRCPGASGESTYTSGSPCEFTRKLCVSCDDSSGTVVIKVQANGLPDHCFTSTVNNAEADEQEWSVNFNPDVEDVMNYAADDFDSSEKTDEILCDIQRTAETNMHSGSDYDMVSSGNMETVAALGLSGGYIYNALALGNADAVETEADTMDTCLSHPSPFGGFHYHMWGPCLKSGMGFHDDSAAPDLCRDTDGCTDDIGTFAIESKLSSNSEYTFTAANWDDPIGLARDGHVVIGPYKSDGDNWGCDDRDACNGAFVDGSYVYVGSSTFPYVVGCWGPGPDASWAPTCSSSGCGTATGALQSVVYSVATLAAAVSVSLY